MTIKQAIYMLFQKVNSLIKSEIKTATTGTVTHNDFYYVDIDITSIPPGYRFLSADVVSTQNNRYATVMKLTWAIRVFTKLESTQVTVQVNYIKDL